MTDLNKAFNPVIPPRDLKLPLEIDFDAAVDKIQKWVKEQGIVGVDKVNILAKSKELHGKWLEAKNSRMNYITFKKDGLTETSHS